MRPTVGLHLYGNHLVSRVFDEPGSGELGSPHWSPMGLLADLELRLGLPSAESSNLERSQEWRERLTRLDDGNRFYSRSFKTDPRGTSAELLRWRDGLIEAGWNGESLESSIRLETLAKVERMELPLGPGRVDRLRVVEATLRQEGARIYEAIELLEPRELWPGRWRRIFDLLAGNGVAVERRVEDFSATQDHASDLGRLQELIRTNTVAHDGVLRADGSLLLLTAETPVELADAVAALARKRPEGLCVVRSGEQDVLDAAFRRAGLASQSAVMNSTARPLLQVVPLLLQLAFGSRDPEQLLQLLTLPGGPFAHPGGRALANALMATPGMGNATWLEVLAEHAEELTPFRNIIDGAGFPASGAPTEELLDLVDRAKQWLRKRLASNDIIARIAYQQASSIRVALEQHAPGTIDRWTCEQIIRDAVDEAPGIVREEQAGRIAHVDDPALLFHSFERVIFWNFVGAPSLRAIPWRSDELRVLEQKGVRFPAQEALLAERAAGYRRAALGARSQLILGIPRQSYRQLNRTHPLFDEILARLDIDDGALSRIEIRADQLRTNSSRLLDAEIEQVACLKLPELRRLWKLPKGFIVPRDTLSANSTSKLLGCPLSWVFDYQAGIYPGNAPSLPPDPITYGKLGHRLAEHIFERKLFDESPEIIRRAAGPIIDELVAQEAMGLLTEGNAFELEQLKNQLMLSIITLAEILRNNGLTVKGVEYPIDVKWQGRALNGWIDLLLETKNGEEVILDLKWGTTSYRDNLRKGQALQLAFYGMARQLTTGVAVPPHAAYFSLAGARLLATDAAPLFGVRAQEGPPVALSWSQAEQTVSLVEAALDAGTVPVTGGQEPPSLLKLLGKDQNARKQHLEIDPESACRYCNHAKLCGLHWEAHS